MKQQQSAQPDANYSVHQQPSSSFHGLNQQSTFQRSNQQSNFQGVHKLMGNNPANQLQYDDDPATNVQQHPGHSFHQNHRINAQIQPSLHQNLPTNSQQLGHSLHKNHPKFHSSSSGQNNIHFNPINYQQMGQQQYTNAVHQNPPVFYNGHSNASGYHQSQQTQMPRYGQFNRSFANYHNQYSNQGSFPNPTNNAHQQITPSSHQHQFYNGQNNAGYHQPLRSHMPPPADNSWFIYI